MATPRAIGSEGHGRTWHWWTLGICAALIGLGVAGTFGMSYSTMENQVEHNVDKDAHPGIAGQLNMIERDIASMAGDVSDNSVLLGRVHEAQIRQGVILEQIQRLLNGERP